MHYQGGPRVNYPLSCLSSHRHYTVTAAKSIDYGPVDLAGAETISPAAPRPGDSAAAFERIGELQLLECLAELDKYGYALVPSQPFVGAAPVAPLLQAIIRIVTERGGIAPDCTSTTKEADGAEASLHDSGFIQRQGI